MKRANFANANGEVMDMSLNPKFSDLYTLIQNDDEANSYFRSLPDYVQEQISARADGVNSLASLKDYAENLLRGDN